AWRGAANGRAPPARTRDCRASCLGRYPAGARGVKRCTRWRSLVKSCRCVALFGAHSVFVTGRLAQKAALEHPVDLCLELGRSIGLTPRELGKQPIFAQLRSQITQELLSRAFFVLV